jgi:hypothetical protein
MTSAVRSASAWPEFVGFGPALPSRTGYHGWRERHVEAAVIRRMEVDIGSLYDERRGPLVTRRLFDRDDCGLFDRFVVRLSVLDRHVGDPLTADLPSSSSRLTMSVYPSPVNPSVAKNTPNAGP